MALAVGTGTDAREQPLSGGSAAPQEESCRPSPAPARPTATQGGPPSQTDPTTDPSVPPRPSPAALGLAGGGGRRCPAAGRGGAGSASRDARAGREPAPEGAVGRYWGSVMAEKYDVVVVGGGISGRFGVRGRVSYQPLRR